MEKKIIEEKENMKVQQAAFDKILPGVQARCAVFYFDGGRWKVDGVPLFGSSNLLKIGSVVVQDK